MKLVENGRRICEVIHLVTVPVEGSEGRRMDRYSQQDFSGILTD
jgi:hypothetical protein